MKITTLLLLALMLAAPTGSAQIANNLSLTSHVPYAVGTCADVWGQGDHVFLARRGAGLEILDVSDPALPVSVFTGYASLFVQDVKTSGSLLAFSNESGNGQGVYLLDVTNPGAPGLLSSYGSVNLLTCHNVAFHGQFLYCCSLINNRIVILDISNPSAPFEVGMIVPQAPVSQVHDVTVVDDKLYSSWLSGGFEVHDLTQNAAAPSLLYHHWTPTSFVHNAWPLPDGLHVATTQEVSGGYLEIWNTSQPASITLASQWRASNVAIMHNLLIQDHFAFITNYTEGLRVVDLRIPTAPLEVASYDTFSGVNPFTFGAWGVFPFDLTRICVADFSSGLYVLDFQPLTTSLSANQTVYSGGEVIILSLGLSNLVTRDQPVAIDLTLGVPALGPATLSLLAISGMMPANLSVSAPFAISLPPVVPPLTVQFALAVTSPSGNLLYDMAETTVTLQ